MITEAGIADKIKALGLNKKPGSSMEPGVPYQNIIGISGPCHRRKSELRGQRILELVGDVRGKSILDLGCNVGTISHVLHKAGASVVGIDHDEASLEIARTVYEGIDFRTGTISLESIKRLGHFDVIVWLSQFQWLMAQVGTQEALDCLWEIGRHCNTLVFETAGKDDGQAPLSIGQDEVYTLLARSTIFTDITDCGQWFDDWTPRSVFLCRSPLLLHKSIFSTVEPTERGRIRKTYAATEYAQEMMRRELLVLSMLKHLPCFPEVLGGEERGFVLSWEGPRARFVPVDDMQMILRALSERGMTHRDINPGNLVFNGKNVVLLDFPYTVFPGEMTVVSQDLGGRFKCPTGFNDEYSLRKSAMTLLREAA